jgi:hypothetical protein
VNANPLPSEVDHAAWLKEHEASYELTPVQEHVKDRGLQQTSHALVLFGRFDPRGVPDLAGVARSIHERLQALALEALRDLPVAAAVRAQPFGRATIPIEAPLLADVLLTVVVSPAGPEHALPPAELRGVIALVEGRLRALGLKKR